MSYQKRDNKHFNEEKFLQDLANSRIVNKICAQIPTSKKYDVFHEHFTSTSDKHAPMRNLTKPELAIKLKPWLTTGILKSKSKNMFYYKRFMTTKLDKWYNQYKLYREKINNLLRTSKNMHYNVYFHKFKHNSKEVWKDINDLLSKSKRNDHHQTFSLYENGEYLSDPFQISNKFNEFFTNIGPQLSKGIWYSLL